MDHVFMIMQIGNPQLDKLWKEVYVPAIKACDLEPKRVDRHNEGRLLQSEIAGFLKEAKIVIADLTNERPNCYLEVGYTMGINKFKNLILCAKDNHNPDSEHYVKGGPKIHFDLSGYGFKWWNENKLEVFKEELISTIKYRLSILEREVASDKPPTLEQSTAEIIIEDERSTAIEIYKRDKHQGVLMEAYSSVLSSSLDFSQEILLDAAEKAQISTFGWPIGVVLNIDDRKPRPKSDGITAIVSFPNENIAEAHFDYWSIKKDADFYMLKTIFDDHKQEGTIFFDTRTIRVTELLLYLTNLYKGLGIPSDKFVHIEVTHIGLKGMHMSAAGSGRYLSIKRRCEEDKVTSIVEEKIDNLRLKISDIVFKIISDLALQFEFFKPPKPEIEKLVGNFINGIII